MGIRRFYYLAVGVGLSFVTVPHHSPLTVG
jgi:hypothetical protein